LSKDHDEGEIYILQIIAPKEKSRFYKTFPFDILISTLVH